MQDKTDVPDEYVIDLTEKQHNIFIPDEGITIPGKIVKDKRISGNEKMMLGIILWLRGQGMEVPTNEELAQLVGISPRAIVRSFNNLEDCGYLRRQKTCIRNRKIVFED